MPVMKIADGEIYYEEFGRGFPVLCFAPGSLRSQIDYWHAVRAIRPSRRRPWIRPRISRGHFRVIAMDQRNAGRSRAPVRRRDGWETYARDHIALLDHLGIERCHTLGRLHRGELLPQAREMVPQRIVSAVLMQPIGRVPENIAYTKRETAENWGLGMCHRQPDARARRRHRDGRAHVHARIRA